jgi:hypothetical protein
MSLIALFAMCLRHSLSLLTISVHMGDRGEKTVGPFHRKSFATGVAAEFCSQQKKLSPGMHYRDCLFQVAEAVVHRQRLQKPSNASRYIDHDEHVFHPNRTRVPRFSLNSRTDRAAALAHLDGEGFVVFKAVLPHADVERALRLLWQYLGTFGAVEGNASSWGAIPCAWLQRLPACDCPGAVL